eukprot:m51a1_g13290 putative zinc phosphodiesterase elac protein 2 (367) ;mRNA; r:24-2397
MALDIATRDLAIIFVSHMHADHHLGLPRFLELRCSAGPAAPPLVVVGPRRLQTWLSSYAAVSGRPWLVPSAFVHSADLDGGLRAEDEMDHDGAPAAALPPVLADALDWIGVQLKTAPVEHCHDAYGVAVTHRSGWKIVFSGDTTAPCSSLVELGQGATLLLHEATFDDTMGAEAAAKRHSTVSGALAAAKQMKAEAVVLTHFSQRYPKMGAVAEPGGDKDVSGMHVGMAFDHMRVRRAHLPALHCLIPSLNLLFAGEDDKAADEYGAAGRAAGCLLGLAAGDRNGGPVRMATRLAESLGSLRRFDRADVCARYLAWFRGPPYDDEAAIDTGNTFASVFSILDADEAVGVDQAAARSSRTPRRPSRA